MLHGWMHNMGTAEALLASGDLACSLRYEDLVERLTRTRTRTRNRNRTRTRTRTLSLTLSLTLTLT